TISVSMGIAIYRGEEKNYSEIFKKADIALYKTKSDRSVKYSFYNE
ncbi:MAG: diguanylate cyclase, partial [Clostridiales bacterium]|nr:diguanylate cyclase [Clostridiales bacterium]